MSYIIHHHGFAIQADTATEVLALIKALSTPVPRKPNTSSLASAVEAGCKDLLKGGDYKKAKQLVKELAELGVHVGGSNPTANLAAILARKKELFCNVAGKGYHLAILEDTPPVSLPIDVHPEYLQGAKDE